MIVYNPVNWQSYPRINTHTYLGYLRINTHTFTHKHSQQTGSKLTLARLSRTLLYVPVLLCLYLAAPFCGKPKGFRTTKLANNKSFEK